jgi:HEPN domain-containing protein
MSIPDQDHINKVLLWMSYADEDLDLANYALKMPGSRSYRLIAFHAQQCAEKFLKAYLVYYDIDFPYTHDIRKLLKLCGNAIWIEQIKNAEELTPFAVTTRYPMLDEKVTEIEAVEAVNLASMVRKTIRKALLDEGMTLRRTLRIEIHHQSPHNPCAVSKCP